ncbi:helix-turn-helix domain-containing protein [Gluconobacter kanchanaburiensis]|uniref:Transcriptional regulator n=1 Tax=Gluconobacter kanchanaburiensis NBRC 103587 TaxID=1307948 RepID=A0A511B7L1_9PROT|nr:helix-turn-helix domain-containing protein [Gluconobacter kanchanaburiensis]MBF0862488.1 transcriptional regulator [Gluconobacter kanchanaburiensis]GBR68546.1 Fis family transcriptional regulator [Gluconobacter kanchanaburiensis NBRC 103587]GEK96388.1 transcriptional regulator [Gluconobacter kanchanaburiensis NBRC 103587]
MTLSTTRTCLSDSWARCSTNYNLDPAEQWETQVLSQPELRFVSSRTQRLIQSAVPEMQRLHTLVDPLDFTVLLADPTGIVLSRHTQRGNLSGCRRWRFQAGAVWDERNAGTNAIGTCLREERPVMVVHDQHWRLCFRKLTGMAVPVYNSIGELAGALNICSFTAENVLPAASLLMDALQTTARRVEEKLFHDRFDKDMIVSLGPSTASSAMLVAIDRDGHVRGATHASRKHMHWPEGELTGLPALLTLLDACEEPSFRRAEAQVIRSALITVHGNVSAAARLLGVSRATLHRKIRALGLER